ncbi:MAG: 6-bladed beta-propeller [Candidatus Aminicenantes bacterium]|nr:MAG: 6-bladed beta-propeller [Candidatus Aminicenantes bacterium]
MKKLPFLYFIIAVTIFCSPSSDQIEKYMEDGVEIVINHLEPYKLKGERTNLILEKEFFIDFAGDDIGELGIADTVDFEVDTEGNIYFFYANKEGDLIFKFNPHGNFETSFGQKGQGPGELQWIIWTGVDSQDRLIISDNGNRKVLFFSKDKVLIKEIRYPSTVGLLYPLENGNFFGLWNKPAKNKDKDMYTWAFSLYNPQFEEIKLLDTQKVYDFNTQGFRGIISRPFNARQFSKENIFVACEDRGYEILKYDLEGNLIQKIRKEFEPVAISENVIKEKKKQFETMGGEVWFPKFWLPMGNFFLDDDGRIYVKTFERGENPGEYIFDIFNPEGIFIGRKAMNILTLGDAYACAKSRRDRLYCFQEKSDGFREFIVYRMKWE